jgi:predicted  nucleic acid-binding Zn-ribbon protein
VLLIVGGIAGGLALKGASDKAAADEARHQQEMAETKAQSEALQRQLENETSKISTLMGQLGAAKDEAAREALQKQLDEARRAQATTQRNYQRVQSTGNTGGTSAPKPRAACTCQAGDPLCSCIQ